MSHGLPSHTLKAARRLMRQVQMVYIGPANDCFLVEKSNGKRRTISPVIMQSVQRVPFKYSVLIVVCGRDEFKREYIKSLQIDLPNPCLQSQLTDQLTELHEQLITDIPDAHFTNLAWIANFESHEFDEAKAFDLIKKHGAFECLAKWQTKDAA